MRPVCKPSLRDTNEHSQSPRIKMTTPAKTAAVSPSIHPALALISETEDRTVRAFEMSDGSGGCFVELSGEIAENVSAEMDRTGESFADLLKRWLDEGRQKRPVRFAASVAEAIRDVERITGWPEHLILAEAVRNYAHTIGLACDAAAQLGRCGSFGFAKAEEPAPKAPVAARKSVSDRLTKAQAAVLLGQLIGRGPVTPKTIERWCQSRGLPCLKLGGRITFAPSELRAWVESQKKNRQPQPLTR